MPKPAINNDDEMVVQLRAAIANVPDRPYFKTLIEKATLFTNRVEAILRQVAQESRYNLMYGKLGDEKLEALLKPSLQEAPDQDGSRWWNAATLLSEINGGILDIQWADLDAYFLEQLALNAAFEAAINDPSTGIDWYQKAIQKIMSQRVV